MVVRVVVGAHDQSWTRTRSVGCAASGTEPPLAAQFRHDHRPDRSRRTFDLDPVASEARVGHGQQHNCDRDRRRRIARVGTRSRRSLCLCGHAGCWNRDERVRHRVVHRCGHGARPARWSDDRTRGADGPVRQTDSYVHRNRRRRGRMAARWHRRGRNRAVRPRNRSAGSAVHELLADATENEHGGTRQRNR